MMTCVGRKSIFIKWLAAILFLTVGTSYSGDSEAPSDADAAVGALNRWKLIATSNPRSPVAATGRDKTWSWTSPSGESVILSIQSRRPSHTIPVHIPAIPPTQDATPIVDGILRSANRRDSIDIYFDGADYYFNSLAANCHCHLSIKNFQDLKVSGQGARLHFALNAPGIEVSQSKRLEIQQIQITYQFPSTTVGVTETRGGKHFLVLDRPLGDLPGSGIYEVSELESHGLRWKPGGDRLIVTPSEQGQLRRISDHEFESSLFGRLKVGRRYFVSNYWYGGQAIQLTGPRDASQNEDISLMDVKISGTPGVGINVESLRRGLLIFRARIAPDNFAASAGSTAWDGIHIAQGGGDIAIVESEISGTGDDAVNISNPVHFIRSVKPDGSPLTLEKYVYNIRQDDTLLFFDDYGTLIGQESANNIDSEVFPGKRKIKLRSLVGAVTGTNVRVQGMLASRYIFKGNNISDCYCHGIVAQIPYGLIEENLFQRTAFNSIRLTTDLLNWHEGIGAFATMIRGNRILDPGVDRDMAQQKAAIAIYGGVKEGGVVHSDIWISDNFISNPLQQCISVANTDKFQISNNVCLAAAQNTPAAQKTIKH
jgi:hypothetical protein